MFNLFKLAGNTFKESVREPIYGVLLLLSVLLIGHYPAASLFVFSEQIKLVVDSSMATTLTFGLFISIFAASHTVSREMRNGTVLLLMSKPVARWTFVMAKILGIAAASLVFVFITSIASIIAIYVAADQFHQNHTAYYLYLLAIAGSCVAGGLMNFFKGTSFTSAITLVLSILMPVFALICIVTQSEPTISIANYSNALILLFFAVAAMSTITVVFATRLNLVSNLCVCTLIFFLGLVSGYLFNRETGSSMLDMIYGVLYAILPNWQFFWVADALSVNRAIPFPYVLQAGLYVILYMILSSMWAVAFFLNREIAKDSR